MVPTCLEAASAVHSSSSNSVGVEFWVVMQAAGAPPLARAEFNATAASGGMCVDCSGEGQAVFGQGGDLGYSLSFSATGARVRLPGTGSPTPMRSAATLTDVSAQYPNFAIVRWRVEYAGDVSVWANGELLGSADLGTLPALSLSELGISHNFTLGAPNASSTASFFSGLVGELLVFDELLTDSHAAEVLGYLDAR